MWVKADNFHVYVQTYSDKVGSKLLLLYSDGIFWHNGRCISLMEGSYNPLMLWAVGVTFCSSLQLRPMLFPWQPVMHPHPASGASSCSPIGSLAPCWNSSVAWGERGVAMLFLITWPGVMKLLISQETCWCKWSRVFLLMSCRPAALNFFSPDKHLGLHFVWLRTQIIVTCCNFDDLAGLYVFFCLFPGNI